MAYKLADRVAIVTGGSRGLGLLVAKELARRGARVVLAARDPEELARAEFQVNRAARGRGGVVSYACDVRQQASAEALVAFAEHAFGNVDIVINNAGIIAVGPLESMTTHDFEDAMATHFWAPYFMTTAVLPTMRARHEGRIVNIASIGGRIAVPHMAPYAASKFALVGFSDAVRAEAAKDNVRVTTVCPGLMRTGSPPNATFKGNARAEYAWFSVSASLPFVAMNAERAARRIVDACRKGSPQLILTPQAKLAVAASALVPRTFAALMRLAGRFLPRAPHGDLARLGRRGAEVESKVTQSVLTTLGRRASTRNNEVGVS